MLSILSFPLRTVLRRASEVYRKQLRSYSCSNYFVTTPIFYVNSAPHIGHLYTAVLADAVARWHELKGGNIVFSTGTDEHGLKIQQAAEKLGISPLLHCDNVSEKFQTLFDIADVRYTDFIRTTECRHKEVVCHFWDTLAKNGYIYKGGYEGWYSVADEAFLSDKDVIDMIDKSGNKIKVAIDSHQPVTWTKEDNYMFKLSAFKDGLSNWLDKEVIHPKNFEKYVRNWVDDLEDLSVSRQRDRLSWGIPVPADDTQTIYVWLDALVNYLTVSGYPDPSCDWPPDCHVVGKDILRFHAIYWPAFLLAAGLPLPKRVQCHSHFLVDHNKMSKSRGNVIDPFDRISRYTSDGLRYFLMKTGVPHMDCNLGDAKKYLRYTGLSAVRGKLMMKLGPYLSIGYSDSKAVENLNNDLAEKLGNLLHRISSRKINMNVGDVFPALNQEVLEIKFSEEDIKMYRSLQKLPDEVDEHYCEYNIYRVIDSTHLYIKWANKLLTDHKPWQLAKNIDNTQYLRCLIHIVMETLRINGILLQPIIPNISRVLLERLGIPEDERMIRDIYFGIRQTSDIRLGKPHGVLFPKLEESK